jgi:hypothetical protein
MAIANITNNILTDSGVATSSLLTTSAAASTYQTILTNPVTGTGTTNYLPKFTGTSSIANSIIYDNSGNVLINTTDASIGHRLAVYSATEAAQLRVMGLAPSVLFTESTTNTNSYSAYLGVATSVNNFVTGTGIGDYVMANNSNYPLVFATNGSIKMKMFANGNLAVGTTTDSGYKLDVNGTFRAGGAATFSSTIKSSDTNGFAIGSIASFRRIQYGSDAATAFSLLTDTNSYAGLYAGAATFSAKVSAKGGSNFGGYYMDYQSDASSRSFRVSSEHLVFADFVIQRSTTRTGTTYEDLLYFDANRAATFSSSVFAASYYGQTLTTSSQAAINLNNTLDNQICLAGNARMTVVDYTTTKYLFTITPTGNVGIGTSSPSQILDVRKATASGDTQFNFVNSQNSSSGNTSVTSSIYLGFFDDSSGLASANKIVSGKSGDYTSAPTANSFLAFYTTAANSCTEKMRITSGGIVDIAGPLVIRGVLPADQTDAAVIDHFSSTMRIFSYGASGVTGDFQFRTAAGGAGSNLVSTINGTTGVYVAVSNINRKKDFEESTIGLNEILGLKPTLYRMKDDDELANKELGFIAQEVKEFIPQAYVESGKDENKFIGLNYQAITTALVKAVQELKAEIDILKNK